MLKFQGAADAITVHKTRRYDKSCRRWSAYSRILDNRSITRRMAHAESDVAYYCSLSKRCAIALQEASEV